MARDLNQCHFIGRLGRDPEIRYSPNGAAVANFSIACSDDYKDKNSGEMVKQTIWIRLVMFGRLAEIAGEYLKKGSQVYVSGKQVTRKWQDKEGNDRYTTEVQVGTLQMLDTRSGGSSNQDTGYDHASENQDSTGGGGGATEDFDSDIPFITRHGIY